MPLTLDDMQGPCPQSRALQFAQWQALRAYYQSFNEGDTAQLTPDEVREAPRVIAARMAYEESVGKLEALLGAEAHCSQVDLSLWESFSDAYKECYGSRPRIFKTRADVQLWFAQLETLPQLEQQEALA
jgi:hypothetical protein